MQRGGHFINMREGQSLRIEMADHVLEHSLIPLPQSWCLSVNLKRHNVM